MSRLRTKQSKSLQSRYLATYKKVRLALVHVELGEGIDGELEAGNRQLCENLKDTQEG
jgi:hypothetical protein